MYLIKTNFSLKFTKMFKNRLFRLKVYDGDVGAKGEAGVPGRFGYDGFPGMFIDCALNSSAFIIDIC